MKKLLTILILLLTVVSKGYAIKTSVWTGNEPISWNQEIYSGTQYEATGIFTGLAEGDIISISTTKGIEEPQYVLTYKAGSGWEWTDLSTTVTNNVILYTVESSTIATEIAERGLIFRGQGYNITEISIDKCYITKASVFTSLVTNDKIRISLTTESESTLRVYTKNNDELVELYNGTPSSTTQDIIITDADHIAAIKENGLIMYGSTATNIEASRIARYTLTVTDPANGAISVSTDEGITTTEDRIFDTGTKLTLTATPASDYSFTKWTVNGADYTDNPQEITMTDATTVAATFTANAIPAFSLDGFTADAGNTYDATTHELTTASSWSGMQLWIGNNSTYSGSKLVLRTSEASQLKITVGYTDGTTSELQEDAAAMVRAIALESSKKIQKVIIQNQVAGAVTFTEMALDPSYTLTITAPENGSFTVNDGTNNLATGASVSYGTTLTLTATPATDYSFTKWTIDGTDYTDNPYSFDLTADVTVTASFSNKSERVLKEESVAISEGDIKINRGLFANAVAGDIIRIYGTPGEGAKIALEPSDYSGALEGANWAEFSTSPFELVLTDALLTTVKAKDLLIRGEKYTFKKAVLYTESELGNEIIDIKSYTLTIQTPQNGTITVKRGNEQVSGGSYDEGTVLTLTAIPNDDYQFVKWTKNGADAGTESTLTITMDSDVDIAAFFEEIPKPVIDDETGETDLSNMTAQDETTTVSYDENTGAVTMTTTEPDKGVQIWFDTPEEVKGNVLLVDIAEANVTVSVTVRYTDGTESSMTSATAASQRTVARRAASNGTTIAVPVETGKQVQCIEVKNAEAGVIHITKMTVFEKNVFDENGKADLSMGKAQSNATYDISTYTLATTKGWTGLSITPLETEEVKGVELMVKFASKSQVKVAVTYSDDEGSEIIMEEAAPYVKMTLDGNKYVKDIMIQATTAAIIRLTEVAVNQTATPDEIPEPVFSNGKADLSRFEVQDATKVMYNAETYKMATTDGWIGVQMNTSEAESVSGAELAVSFTEVVKVKLSVTYKDGTQADTISAQAQQETRLLLDATKVIQQIQVQPTEAGALQFVELVVRQMVTPDELPEPVFSNGKADLSRFEVQEANQVMYNAETYKMATTDGWIGVQMNTSEAESVSGAELAVSFTEAVKVKLSVIYKDGTQADTISAQAQQETRLLLDATKVIQQIQVQPTEAGALQFVELVVRQTPTPDPEPVYLFNEQGEADLTMFQAMDDNASYDTTTHQITATQNWAGIQAWLENPQSVNGNMLSVKLVEEGANIRVTIGYTDGTESAADGSKAIATETGTEILVPNDATKEIQKIMIQVVEMGSVTLQSITGIDYSVTELEEGETRLLWKNSQGVELHWNSICEQDAVYGALLKEDQQLCITIISRDEDNEWPKVFIRDINNQEVGEVVELNSLKQFPNVIRLTLTAEMVSRMADGFSICGDGITVNRVELYQPYAPQAGDINLKELNGGWNATYDAASHTITTSARWAARGWDIGDSRYNSYDLIQVKFLAVDFPVTLKMEYTDANGNKQATSTGVSAGNTTLQMPIPENIQQIDKVYLIWQQPASLTLTAAEVLSESDWNYPELLSKSTDIRYITHDGESDKWYDLNGRRVEQPGKGLYIKNGKKTIISK